MNVLREYDLPDVGCGMWDAVHEIHSMVSISLISFVFQLLSYGLWLMPHASRFMLVTPCVYK